MSLKLICGPTGSGKTSRAIEAFLAALDRGENALFVAPSGPDVRHFQRRILDIRPVLTAGRIATFNNLLAEFLEDETDPPRVLASAERTMLLRAVADGPGKPELLTDSSNFDGFITELARLIEELEQLGVQPKRLARDLKEWARGDSWRRGLNNDLFRLFNEYQSALREQGAEDEAQVERRAINALAGDKSLLGYQSVIVDGFYDFTPLELELVGLLRQAATELVITLPFQEGKTALDAPGHYFGLLQPGAELELLEESFEGGRAPAISHIAENLFEDEPARIEAGSAVTVMQAAGVRGQAELVAAEVLRLWREEGIGLDDMAVVTHSHGPDNLAVASAFADFGIPFEMPAPIDLMSTPVGRTAAAALDLAAGRGGRANLFTYLRSPLMPAEAGEVDRFDRDTRSQNSDDVAALILEWNLRNNGPLEEIDRLSQAATRGLQPLAEELADIMRRLVRSAMAGASVEKIEMDALALKSLVTVCEETAGMEEQLQDLYTGGDALALDKSEFGILNLLRDSVEKASVRPLAGMRRDCVRLLDPHRVLNQRFDAVFVCGLLERQFPSLDRESAFLTGADRDWLRENAGLQLKSSDLHLAEERFLFQRTLTRARSRVYLCYPYCDQEGKPVVRSLFVDDTLDLFEDKSWDPRQKRIGDVAFQPAEAPTDNQALLSLASKNPQPAACAVKARGELLSAAGTAGLEERLRRAFEAIAPSWPIVGDEVKKHLAEQEYFKVTDLERYLECPFRFFIEKHIRPQPMERDDFILARGSAAHDILFKFFEELQPGKIILSEADDLQVAEARRIMERLVMENTEQLGNDLRAAISRIELASHLDRLIFRERVMRPEFEPYRHEWSFGICDAGATSRFDEKTMLQFGDVMLCGRIDRVDLRRGTNQAIVIDYKTGGASSLTAQANFEKKCKIQVPLYMLAIRDIWGLEPIGGEYYGVMADKRRGLYLNEFAEVIGYSSAETTASDFVEPDLFEERLETAKSQALQAVAGIRSGSFNCETPPDIDPCKYCDYDIICRKVTPAGAPAESGAA